MDPGLARRLLVLAFASALIGGVALAHAQKADQPVATTPPSSPGPPPSGPPGPDGSPPPPAPAPEQPVAAPEGPGPPSPGEAAPPARAGGATNAPVKAAQAKNAVAPEAPKPPPARPSGPAVDAAAKPPPAAPPPGRGPTAVIQVLDKVSAETLRFEAPIGKRVRYKTLVFTVRVCEVRGAADPLPRPAAYMVIDSEAAALPGNAPPAPKEVYRGWMFAAAPGLHPLEHPIYDAWLVSCSAAAPVS